MEALQQGFVMCTKMVCFNVTKNLEDFRVTLDRVSMVTKWKESLKHAWDVREVLHVRNC
jgi:hypothetical protein